MGKKAKKKILCPTGKKRFKNDVQASGSAMSRMRSANDPPGQLRVYQCDVCNGWHMTKMELAL